MSAKSVLCVGLGCVLAAAAAGLAGEPRVRITEIDAAQRFLKGVAENLSPEEAAGMAVVPMIKTDAWYRHPFAASSAKIEADGTWQILHVPRGGEKEVAALLVRKGARVPEMASDLRDIRCLASAVLPYQAKYVAREGAAPAEPPREADAQPAQAKPALAVWVEADERTVRGFVTGIAPKDLPRYAVRLLAHVDIDYEQPYVGDRHPIAQDGMFETWTRRWVSIRAVLVERATDAEVTSATFRRGDPKAARPQGKNP